MAVQTGTGKKPKPPGAPATLKQGTRPAGETYKSDLTKGNLARGGLGPVRKDPITARKSRAPATVKTHSPARQVRESRKAPSCPTSTSRWMIRHSTSWSSKASAQR